jgi:hypothetical protein
MNISVIVSLLLATASFDISMLNFKRQKKIDSENHIYKIKIELYNEITGRVNKTLTIF